MLIKRSFIIFLVVAAMDFFPVTLCTQGAEPIKLPPPKTEGGKPVMQALKERKSAREFSAQELPMQVISDPLWAARGVNRRDTGGLTAPTAKNMQEIDVYVAKSDGLFLYDAKENALVPVLSGDIRAMTGGQPFVKEAPVNLIYVSDASKMIGMPDDAVDFYAATDTGFISENVYLFCASVGLSTVVRAWVNKPALAKAMKLRLDQKIILTQTVGYPKK